MSDRAIVWTRGWMVGGEDEEVRWAWMSVGGWSGGRGGLRCGVATGGVAWRRESLGGHAARLPPPTPDSRGKNSLSHRNVAAT